MARSPSSAAPAAPGALRALALAALGAGLASAQCYQPSKCIFHVYNSNNEVQLSWSLAPLCNGGAGYSFVNYTTGQKFVFEICGQVAPIVPTDKTGVCTRGSVYNSGTPCTIDSSNVAVPGTEQQSYTYCNADYNSYPFQGNVLQFIEFTDNTVTPPVTYGNGGRPTCVLGGSPNKGYRPQDNVDFTGFHNYCSTGQCEVLSYGNAAYDYRYNPNPRTGGIFWIAYGDTPDNGDDFVCPTDPYTGFARARQVNFYMACNSGGSINDPLQITNI